MNESIAEVTRHWDQRTTVAMPVGLERTEQAGASGQTRAKVRRGTILSLPSQAARILMVIASAVLLAGVGLRVIAKSEAAPEDPIQPRILTVETQIVEPVTSFRAARDYTGAIVARRASELGFEFGGKLEEIHVDEGNSVTAGAILATLNTDKLETNRRQLVAKRAQAAARLAEMVAGPRAEEIAAARSQVAALQAQVELLQLQVARHKKLVVSRASSQDEYEQHVFGLKARQAELSGAQHHLQELLNGTRQERIDAQRAVVEELDAAIVEIDVDLGKSTLKAPFDGTIARRSADDGTVLEAGQPVLRLVEDQVLEAWIGLPVQAAHQLDEASPQRVKIGGRHFAATVSARFPEIDPATRTRKVVLRLDESAADHVVHGQVVRLELDEAVAANGYWLPSTALAKGARGLWTAFVVVNAEPSQSTEPHLLRVQRRDLEVLHTESDRVLVRGTLNSGDRVISSGTHRVVPGQFVQLAK